VACGDGKRFSRTFLQRHRAADVGVELAYREAFATVDAQSVVGHLVNNRGLQLDLDVAQQAEKNR